LKDLLFKLPELFGNLDKLDYAKSMTTNTKALNAIERLEKVYEILNVYGYGNYVTFDLGMLSKYNYYTGIIFRGFTYGTGDAIVTGGRYDNLVCQFGKDSAAIGVAIVVDQLMNALSRQKIEIELESGNTLILYRSEYRQSAITLAGYFRDHGMNVEMLLQSENQTLEDYKGYANRMGVGGILFLKDGDTIDVINIGEGITNEAKIADLIR
ncbi:MAG TPA: ATP phosphoribosyltransferase regulatory subunit, partial [Lachnospiraceae bacterium]|nr:ATP phosphoribosyltransferase regulatory subunit [Lachnospiraceae bacterium]